jgi:hypothetical protein
MPKIIVAVLFLFVLTDAAIASSTTLICPGDAPAAVSSAYENGWVPFKSGVKGPRAGLEFLLGHPSEMASLVPDSQRRRGLTLESTWRLTEASDHY